jgi:hypothetical protein
MDKLPIVRSSHTDFVWRNLMVTKICVCCCEPFVARPQVPKQAFCANPACQRERRQQWQRKKMLDDPFYRENQQDAQRAWRTRNPDYSRDYRAANPEYTQKNRKQQRSRSQDGQALEKQTSDVSIPPNEIPPGIYRIRHIQVDANCKTDAWIVEITPVNADSFCKTDACKDRT